MVLFNTDRNFQMRTSYFNVGRQSYMDHRFIATPFDPHIKKGLALARSPFPLHIHKCVTLRTFSLMDREIHKRDPG